jgi:hypothetical protein
MKYPKRSQYKYAKSRYRIGNCPAENQAGSAHMLISQSKQL